MMTNSLSLTAPAKINLTLDITGIRPDGYHELVTVMHQIRLADTVVLSCPETGPSITLDSGHPALFNDERNLAFRAADLMLRRYVPDKKVAIRIHKRIPIEAGLAGGSTDAAAVISGINQLFSLQLSQEELCECGALLGADVPFCIVGGTALCTGKGDIIQPLPEGTPLQLVLIKPDFSLSTAAVYRHFDTLPPLSSFSQEAFLNAWKAQDISRLNPTLFNVLEYASCALKPEIREIMRRLQTLGAVTARMSGSGPSVFGVFPDEVSARAAAAVLKPDYPECFVTGSFPAHSDENQK